MLLAGSDNVKKLVSGGDPMFLNSPITLCGRVDLNADRFFSGRLAELSIFDDALNKQQVILPTHVISAHGTSWMFCQARHALQVRTAELAHLFDMPPWDSIHAGGIPSLLGHRGPAECVAPRCSYSACPPHVSAQTAGSSGQA